jgi:hypothetical protein
LDAASDTATMRRRAMEPNDAGAALVPAAIELAARVRDASRLVAVGPAELCSHVAQLVDECEHPTLASAHRVPAIGISGAPAAVKTELEDVARSGDVCIVFARDRGDPVRAAVREVADVRDVATIMLGAASDESYVIAYHRLWELVQAVLARDGAAA